MAKRLNESAGWTADVSAIVVGRAGRSPRELAVSVNNGTCPDILLLSNDDYLVIGADVTDEYRDRLPLDAGCALGEKIVMIPNVTVQSMLEAQSSS